MRILKLKTKIYLMQEIFNLDFFFKDKIYVITGANSRLAKPIINFLQDKGSKIICIGRINRYNNQKNIFFYKCNLQNEDEINFTINLIKKKFNFLNGLIHFASGGKLGHFSSITKKDFNDSYNVNVISLFLLINKLKDFFKIGFKYSKSKSSIVCFSSIYGLEIPDFTIYKSKKFYNPIQYGCSKSSMMHMIRYLSKNKEFNNIKINNIIPGAFPNVNKKFLTSINQKKLLSKIPMSRFGKPDDVLGPVIFLLSNMSNYVTGTNLVVDGGFSL
jgi:NAD(P)-dependent dehydrogenase (short-subunit alcohol dehydrogenase family)